MSAPKEILVLVERFDRNAEAYRSAAYKEAQARKEFIDPFFKCLGWDIDNTQGYAEAYKDVIHEDAIKVGGATKAPDYCFRIGGARKFFLEAKKPAVNGGLARANSAIGFSPNMWNRFPSRPRNSEVTTTSLSATNW
jgi:predicted type IV restriction endonuclease